MEIIFAVPGMGTALVQAVSNRDYPTVQAIVFLMARIIAIMLPLPINRKASSIRPKVPKPSA